jgi:hypothetical protein
MLRVLYNLYQGARRVVAHDGCVTDAFTGDLGLHEGDVISPTLYLHFIDDLLTEVWQKHPGVTLLGPSDRSPARNVAAMQADDFVAVCGSLSEVQAVAQTVYEYSQKWQFRLNSSKSAIMHVTPHQVRSNVAESGIVWNGVPVPVVAKYCYLGLWFQNTCSWNLHFDEMMKKVERRKNMLMPIWKNRHISVEVKRIVMLTCVRPIIEYGAEVWAPTTVQKWAAIDRVQTDIIKCAMHVAHEKPCTHAVLAEWGVKPMHMWMHARALEYYFRVQRMEEHRLTRQVLDAVWVTSSAPVSVLPWQKYVSGLLHTYGIDVDVALSTAERCKAHVREQIATKYADTVLRDASVMSSLQRYLQLVNPEHVQCMEFCAPRPYLRGMYPSFGFELLMRVRLGCLCVHEQTSRYGRRNMDEADNEAGQAPCPACGAPVESLAHFMFECHATTVFRDQMFANFCDLIGGDQKLQQCLGISCAREKVARFVSCDFWKDVDDAGMHVPRFIAAFLEKAWTVRNQCKHGRVVGDVSAAMQRGADGNNARA